MSLSRFDPMRDMMSLREAMDRLFEESFVPSLGRTGQGGGNLPLDIYEEGDNLVVKASLPGVKPEDVNIEVQDNVLTISGETKSEFDNQPQSQGQQGQQANKGQQAQGQGRNWHLREHRYGRFMRSISLPYPIQTDQAQAEFEHGILTLRLPKAEEAKPKQIQVKARQGGK